MSLVQDIIDDKPIGDQSILDTIQTKINGLQQSDLVGTTEKVETTKIKYLEALVNYMENTQNGSAVIEEIIDPN